MARTQGTTARTQRLITVVAMCLLALTSALAIGRVFIGTASTYEMVVVALASALLACAMERRNLLLATAMSALGMLIAIGVFVFPQTTWFGLPTLETISAAVRAAGLIGEQARIQVAPTAPLPPLLLAALTGTWAAIFSAHALAFRAGSPLLALLPPVALVAFADTVLEDVVRPVYGVAFLVAATAVVFADSLRRVQGWGPVWASPGRAARLTSTAGKGARRVAAATVAVAIVSPLLIPGFGSKAILDFSSRNEDQVRIDPLVSVQAQLDRDEPIEVFEVDTQEPVYWRMVALPEFDGTSWKPEEDPVAIDVGPDTPLVTNARPDPALVGEPQTVEVNFRTASDLALPWLPVPYLPVSTNVLADGLRWDPEGGSLLLSEPVDSATSYSVNAQLIRPTPEALREEQIPTSPDTARYTQLPSDFPPEITQIAQAWTTDALTPYDKVIAIQQKFNGVGSEFTYDQTVEPRNDSSALLDFLQNTKKGFCQQFASSMAVMLRSIGIPARVAVGFTAGTFDDATDSLRVTTENAHAWVEVLFPGYGWLTFEPTPGRQDVAAYPYTDPTVGECTLDKNGDCIPIGKPGGEVKGGKGTAQGPATITGEGREGVRPKQIPPEAGRGGVDPDITVPEPARRITVRQAALLALLLGLIVLAMIPVVRAWRRRRRLRRASDEPRGLILATYDVFTERAGDLGFPREPGQTVEEYRARILASQPLSGGDLDRLTRLTADAAYAPRDPQPDQAREATQAADSALKELKKRTGFGQRVGGLYRRT
jgi:transglutaminase-like putative cysteine protease